MRSVVGGNSHDYKCENNPWKFQSEAMDWANRLHAEREDICEALIKDCRFGLVRR